MRFSDPVCWPTERSGNLNFPLSGVCDADSRRSWLARTLAVLEISEALAIFTLQRSARGSRKHFTAPDTQANSSPRARLRPGIFHPVKYQTGETPTHAKWIAEQLRS